MSWLDWLLRKVGISGTDLPPEPRINLIAGSNITIAGVDNPGTQSSDVTISATGGGGGTVPTGTGFTHITSGVQDATARAVNVSTADITGVVPIANGGTGLSTVGASGYLLTSSGTSASWLPAPSSGITALTGDVIASGSGSVAATVEAIQGVTILGSAAANKALVAMSASVASWSTVPVAALAAGTSAQILVNSATPTPTWVTMSGDVAISSSGATTVGAISGTSPIAITPSTLQWASATASPTLAQASVSTASATGAVLTVQAQNATGTTSVGGIARIKSGSGTSANGDVQFYAGSTQRARIYETQQHHLQLGDGGGTAAALRSVDFGLVINDSSYGWSALVVNSGYTFFEYAAAKSFLVVGASDPGLTSYIVPLIIDGQGNALFQRGVNTVSAISGVVLGAVADVATSYVFVARGASGQTANLISAQNSTPSTVFEVTPSGNIALGAAGSYGGALGGAAYFVNIATAPTSNPSGGGVLYAQAGALKWRGSSGTITTLAPA